MARSKVMINVYDKERKNEREGGERENIVYMLFLIKKIHKLFALIYVVAPFGISKFKYARMVY